MVKVAVFILEGYGSGNVEKTREWEMQVYYLELKILIKKQNARYTRIGDEV
ncbi:hypothetical protein IMY05_016G0146100 [Salix suchowensis]|nr:hypothetical protein IMY05_016G0146100 [Salix suchowensis]